MVRTLLLTALFAVNLTSCARAQDAWDIKVYPAPRAQGTIRVDGELAEAAWAAAPLVSGFTQYDKPTLMEVQTSFRVLYDDNSLYLGITCDEPRMDKLVPLAHSRDAKEIFGSEAVEVFVDPTHDHSHYFQFGINAAGSLFDGRGNDPYWNSKAVAKTTLDETSWTLELAIPWEDLGVQPRQGRVIGFNVDRDRNLLNAREWSNWAQQNANFHDPERFAHLVLSPSAEELGRLGPELRKGDRRGALLVYGQEGFSQGSYRVLAEEALAKLAGYVNEFVRLSTQETDALTRKELETRAAQYQADLAQLTEAVRGPKALDAAAWVKTNLRISQLIHNMELNIWDARLAALLAGI